MRLDGTEGNAEDGLPNPHPLIVFVPPFVLVSRQFERYFRCIKIRYNITNFSHNEQ